MSDEEEVEGVTKYVEVDIHNFETKLRELKQLNTVVEECTEALKKVKAEQEALSYGLAQYMLSGSIGSIVLDGTKFTQKQRVYSKVEDKDALRSWIIDNNAVDLLMAVHPSKLTAYCNEVLEAGGDVPKGVNPNFIKYYVHAK